MKTLIIQTSHFHTASTFLINALYGLIPELRNTRIVGYWDKNICEQFFDDIIILKWHSTDIDQLILECQNEYNLYFICSERKQLDLTFNDKYKLYTNVVVFDFDELNESSTNTLPNIIQHVHNKINNMLNIKLNVEGGISRIMDMNKRYEEIKHLPFNYIDDFYEIHGSHRNRKSQTIVVNNNV